MALTLEERERRAYITNSPEAALLGELADAEWGGLDEMRHEVEMSQQEAKDAEADNVRLRDDLEAAETKVEKLEGELDEATQVIEAAGLDLV